MGKRLKVVSTVCMSALFAAVFITSVMNLYAHKMLAKILLACFALHFFVHSKWFFATAKKLFEKHFSKRIKAMFVIDCLLLIVFALVFVSGRFLATHAFMGALGTFAALHIAAATLGAALIAAHVGFHLKKRKVK